MIMLNVFDKECNVCLSVNQGFEPDEPVENTDQQSSEKESGEHTHI